MFNPRDYQEAAHSHLLAYLFNQPHKNPLVVAATGTGKSLLMAMAKWHLMELAPHLRILNLTHVKELVEGNYKTLKRLWPEAPAGVYSAGLKIKDARHPITFCGIQSVAKRPATFGKIDFVFIDEAHRMSPNDEATYGKFLAALREVNPNLIVVGYTATDYRMKGGRLTDHGLFDDVVFDIGSGESFIWLIQNGYLSNLVPVDTGFELDESQIRLQGGEYRADEASAAWKDQGLLEEAVNYQIAIAEKQGRKCWMNFCQSIDDAELVADMFTFKGYPVQAVHSKRDDRDEVIARFKAGELIGITNKDVLTTGFDHPPIDLIGMLRLTRSPGLWVQMLGRGTRPVFAPGFDIDTVEGRLAAIAASPKQNCLVLDFAGNTKRLGPINYPIVPAARKGKGGGKPPVRICKECDPWSMHHTSVKVCPHCGFEFPPPETFKATAGTDALVLDLANLPPPPPREEKVYSVHEMICEHHHGKGGKKDTMRVRYRIGYSSVSTWVCIEHPENSWARKCAESWWTQHGGQIPVPDIVEDALEQVADLNMPKFIKVLEGDKYPEVLAYDFVGTAFELDLTSTEPKLKEPDPDPLAYAGEASPYGHGQYDDEIPF